MVLLGDFNTQAGEVEVDPAAPTVDASVFERASSDLQRALGLRPLIAVLRSFKVPQFR